MAKRETFRNLIAANRRKSAVLIGFMGSLLVAAGAVFGGAYGDLWGGVIIASVVALVMLMFAWFSGSEIILSANGAMPLEKADCPELYNVVEEMAIASGLPMPQIYLINSDCPNAFATGRDPDNSAVAVTVGLMEKLNREELQGVIAHEMGHIRNYDIRFSMLMAVLAGGIVLLSEIFLRMGFFTSGRRRDNDKDNGLQIILMLVGLVFAILSPLITSLIQMAMSRQREYLADATAVEFTRNPRGLASALAKLAGDTTPLEYSKTSESMYIVSPAVNLRGGADSWFSTHPPIQDRIKRLMDLC